MKFSRKKVIITAVVVLVVIVSIPFIDYFVMKPTSMKMRVIKAINYIKDEKFDKAAEFFGFFQEPGISSRVQTKEEFLSRLEDMAEQGIKLSSISGVDSYYYERTLTTRATVVITDGKEEYMCTLEFFEQEGGIASAGIDEPVLIRKGSQGSQWERIKKDENDNFPEPVEIFRRAIYTYYRG